MKVTVFEFIDAMNAWHAYPHQDPGKEFMRYLEITHYHIHGDNYNMPESAAYRLRLLLSPHANTIIRMWYAKHDH